MLKQESNRITFNYARQNYSDLILYNVGKEQCRPGHSFGPYIRSHFLFHYVHSGNGFIQVYSKSDKLVCTHPVSAHEGFLIIPDVQVKYFTNDNPWEYTWIEFDGTCLQKLLQGNYFDMNNPVYADLSNQNDVYPLESLMQGIMQNASASYFKLIGFAYLILDQLTKNQPIHEELEFITASPQREYIKRAVELMRANYKKNLTIEYVAACLSLSRSYFSHLFTDEIGLNPCTYLNNLRLERSLEFLNNQDVPIKSIAKEVGFDNPLYFSQVFKKKYGLCPSEFRKQCLQKQANYYDG